MPRLARGDSVGPKCRRRRCRSNWPLRLLILGAPLISVFHGEAFAQTAQVSGRITDLTSAVLQGAVVTVTERATAIRREAASNEQGFYAVPFLRPGGYTIKVTATG